MIVLNKKKIIKVTLSVFLIMFVLTLMVNSKCKKDDYIPTVALPVSGKIVVVDARASESQMKEQKQMMGQQKRKQI